MQYKNTHRIEKFQEHSRTNGGKTSLFKNNSRTNKIREHSGISRTSSHPDYNHKQYKSNLQLCGHTMMEPNENSNPILSNFTMTGDDTRRNSMIATA